MWLQAQHCPDSSGQPQVQKNARSGTNASSPEENTRADADASRSVCIKDWCVWFDTRPAAWFSFPHSVENLLYAPARAAEMVVSQLTSRGVPLNAALAAGLFKEPHAAAGRPTPVRGGARAERGLHGIIKSSRPAQAREDL